MKKFLFYVVCGLVLNMSVMQAYRKDKWYGPRSDREIQNRGYAYFICDQGKCYGVNLLKQELFNILLVLDDYHGDSIDDALEFVRMESEQRPQVALKVLQDFKLFKGAISVDYVRKVLLSYRRKLLCRKAGYRNGRRRSCPNCY